MPNLIHSLDSSSLALLVNLYFNTNNETKNIYSIHDCFAVTANHVENIISILKRVYITIYSEDTYLIKLDEDIKQFIKSAFGSDSFNDDTLEINVPFLEKPLQFPNVDLVLGKEFDFNALRNSKYIIT